VNAPLTAARVADFRLDATALGDIKHIHADLMHTVNALAYRDYFLLHDGAFEEI
jgi:hypothetical protein